MTSIIKWFKSRPSDLVIAKSRLKNCHQNLDITLNLTYTSTLYFFNQQSLRDDSDSPGWVLSLAPNYPL